MSAPGVSPSPLRRWVAPTLVLAAEYVFLSLHVNVFDVSRWGGSWQSVAQLGQAAPLGFALGAAFLVLQPALRASAPSAVLDGPRPRLLAAHAALMLAVVLVADRLFTRASPPPGSAALWIGGWLALLGAATLTLFAGLGHAAQPSRWFTGSAALAAATALVAWLAGLWSASLWLPLSRATFLVVAALLKPFFHGVTTDPADLVLGVDAFVVRIEPGCSGFEGIGLITVLLAAFLYAFRSDLHFPRAWLLLPIGIASVWLGNCLRIAALMIVGARLSPDVALDAFHARSGWLAFGAVALGVATLGRRSPYFSRRARDETENPTTPYLVPFLVLLATALLSEAFESVPGEYYPLRVIAAALALVGFMKQYGGLIHTPRLMSVGLGLVVGVAWLVLATNHGPVRPNTALDAGVLWKALRLAGTVIVVPLCEELAFRGFLQRRLVSRDFDLVSPGTFTPASLLLASLAFGLVHEQPVAGTLAGIAFGIAQIRGQSVTDAVVAHAVANATLAAAAVVTGDFALLG